ncbi:phosphatidylinositol-specific phospholipase C domain-containing protein [Streptomyces triticiradicis]|uniref:1-phosphatidylinositol phosphodiesterase n=2 Tax=Streptomyces triticiradicis TaxID=2651189 RepID=A0A7J5D8J1_9ACTN|nr:phosphatidylinositol-specific phospholipase C domain-containing protein [Streptomyces triticiradicis]
MPRITPHAAGAGSRRRSRPLARLMTVCVALGAVLLTPNAAGAAGSTNQDAYRNLGQADRAEWMWGIASDTPLSGMSIPGTHDTLAIHGGVDVQTQEDYGDSAQTLTAQLERGIRAIDIRARVSGNQSFTIHHSAFYQQANFDDVLTRARNFLRAHPTETIVMRLKAECPYTNVGVFDCANDPKSVTPDKVRSIFADYVAKYPDLFYAPSASGAGRANVPTLGQVRGKLVLGSFDNVESDRYGIKGFDDHKEDHWAASTIPEKWGYVKDNVNKAITSPSSDLYLTYSSASTAPFNYSPANYAGGYQFEDGSEALGVNYQLMKHLNNSAGRVGIVMMDFPGWGLVNAIIDHNADNAVKGGNRMIWLVNDNKTYVNSLHNRCMVRGPEFDSSKTGGLVTQRECQSTPPSSHQWGAEKPSYDGKGYYWIKTSNGKCLTVPYNNGTPPGSGTQLFWWDCETRWFSGSQMWNIIPTKLATATGSRPAYTFINNWTGQCLSMDPATAATAGGKVTQETCPK